MTKAYLWHLSFFLFVYPSYKKDTLFSLYVIVWGEKLEIWGNSRSCYHVTKKWQVWEKLKKYFSFHFSWFKNQNIKNRNQSESKVTLFQPNHFREKDRGWRSCLYFNAVVTFTNVQCYSTWMLLSSCGFKAGAIKTSC